MLNINLIYPVQYAGRHSSEYKLCLVTFISVCQNNMSYVCKPSNIYVSFAATEYFSLNKSVEPEHDGSSPYSQEPILSQLDPLNTPPDILPEFHTVLTRSIAPRSSEQFPSHGLSHQNLVQFSLNLYACHMSCPLYSP
jgi:hypothetical protein